MFARSRTVLLTVLLSGSMVLADPSADDSLTSAEEELLDWATWWQEHGQGICKRIVLQGRAETEREINANVDRMLDAHMKSLNAEKEVYKATQTGPERSLEGPGALPFEELATLRLFRILGEWNQAEADHSPERAIETAVRWQRATDEINASLRLQRLQDDERLVSVERKLRDRALREDARKYAVNWLLGGHPGTYLPPEWTRAAKGNMSQAVLKSRLPTQYEEFRSVRALLKHLTEVLIEIGTSDFRPRYVVRVERYLHRSRDQAQTLLTALTGRHLEGPEARLVRKQGPDDRGN